MLPLVRFRAEWRMINMDLLSHLFAEAGETPFQVICILVICYLRWFPEGSRKDRYLPLP
jgi:hypothetical protein